jgi:Fasciclin domain
MIGDLPMRFIRTATAAAASVALAAGFAVTAAPSANAGELGNKSLGSILLADGDTFDSNPWDYDIVTQAALAVLDANPSSDVGLLLDGNVPLTAFLPTDRAFDKLVIDLTGSSAGSESATFDVVASLGIDTVETVLLYHVVPGATIDSSAAVAADGAKLATAAGGATFTVDVVQKAGGGFGVRLIDNEPDVRNPWLVLDRLDINEGNKQIAHRIGRVLLPADL